MGLFDKGSGLFGKSSGGILGRSTIMSDGNGFSNAGRPIYTENVENIGEKIEKLFSDPEVEGKKKGYERASKEYEMAFRKVEQEFEETKKLIEEQRNVYGTQAYRLIERLKELERQKKLLESQINSRINHVSKKYNVPSKKIVASMNSGTLWNDENGLDILDIVLYFKEKKMRKAEQRGYAEARELYEKKIQALKSELNRLKEDGNQEIKNLLDQISRIHDAIAEEEMKIAELNLLA